MESRFKPNAEGVWYDEVDLTWRMNEYDEYAVEQAVQLKEQLGNAPNVIVLSIGPDRVREVIKKALAMGCDSGVHVHDAASHLKDPWQIASVIATYAKDHNFDLIFTGMQSQDRGSSQVGVVVAELLGYACATTLVGFEYNEGVVTGKRELEGGVKGIVQVKIPALLTCELGLNVPRYPTLPNILKAKKKQIEAIPVMAILNEKPLTQTAAFYPPIKKSGGVVLEGEVVTMVDQVVSILREKTTLLH